MSSATTTPDTTELAATHSAMHPRHDQTFPALSRAEIDRLRHFGTLRNFHDGQCLFQTGQPGPGIFIVLSGHVAITQRDGLGHVTPVVEQGPGQFLAEVGQLSHRAALVDGHAEGEVETLLIPPEGLRSLLIAEADLGERIMRALILRRVSLIRSGLGGPVLIGAPDLSEMIQLQGFLDRNGYPYHVMDPAREPEAATLVERHVERPQDMPLVVCPDGSVLKNPYESALARQLGMVGTKPCRDSYDVAIVGCGPGGLSTAVYAASEGLSIVVLDLRAFGGQAGASARIENYLGFPTGISGHALTGRAFVQAQKFGAEMMIPLKVKSLDCARADGVFALDIETDTDTDTRVRARAVVVASGARYRRLAIENLSTFEGHGVWYWASQVEARLCAGTEVVLVGGGNSAGQAAVFLSAHVSKVRMVVRSDGLARSMSRYLIERIEATPNIEVMTHTEIVGLEGALPAGLERVRWRNRTSGEETTREIRHVFLFVGADPATDWLKDCGVAVDKSGFIVTGAASTGSDASVVHALESSVPGVFAVGDVRSGSVKRVGAAIGEGAQVVQALHRFLESADKPTS